MRYFSISISISSPSLALMSIKINELVPISSQIDADASYVRWSYLTCYDYYY